VFGPHATIDTYSCALPGPGHYADDSWARLISRHDGPTYVIDGGPIVSVGCLYSAYSGQCCLL